MAVREKPYQIYETDAGYIFDVQGLSRALDEVEGSPLRSFEPTHLDALLDTFCDWSEVREGNYESVIVPATEAVQRLPVEDKEALYDRLCDELAERVNVERENSVSREDIVSVVLSFVDLTDDAYDFMLRYLWDFAANLRDLNPEHNNSLDDVGPLLSAIQELPEPYLATKRNQYEGFRKVREIRYRVLDQIVSGDQVGVEDLDEAIDIVLEKEGESILRAWSPYRIVGQIYYDYFKPRLDFYLESLAERIDEAYPDQDLEHHIVNFQGSRNLLGDFAWIGLYDGPPGSMQQHRQLFLGFYGDPSVSYGLHLGEELRGDNWEQELDLEEVTERASLSIERVIEKIESVEEAFFTEPPVGPEPKEPPSETRYFWATANPAIWSVEEIEGGGEVRYTAYNEKGNKKRIFDSFNNASVGDKVIFYESHPVKAVIAIGTVTEPLDDSEAKQEQGIRIKFDRSVEEITWEELNDIPALENASPITNRAQGSLFELEEAEYDEILALEETTGRAEVSGDALDRFRAKLTPPTFNVSIPDGLYFEDKARLKREIDASLNSGKHIIFTGPPGTGKTKLAKSICVEATQRAQIDDYRFTTATSEWTAFDTIGGYVPRKGDGVQELEFEPRMFLKCFRQDRVVNEWLVIDEINRADIDKAFGQMFSVLSADSTELPYERQRTVELKAVTDSMTDDQLSEIIADLDAFPITPSWRLIATMNTYDKTSLYEMSYAFMRRFNFIHVGIPELTGQGGIRTSLLDPVKAPNYASVWIDEDESLRPILESHHEVITVLWHSINQYKPVGPAIVHDIVRFLGSYDLDENEVSEALSSAFVALVLPQLEGLRPEQQQELIRSLSDGSVETEGGEVPLDLEKEYLERKASDFLKVPFDDGE